MMKRKRLFFVFLTTLIANDSHSQTQIKERKYSCDFFSDNYCESVKYDFTIPYLEFQGVDNILNFINDSIVMIAEDLYNNNLPQGFDTIDFSYNIYVDTCETYSSHNISLNYEVLDSSNKYLSLLVKTNASFEYPGHGISNENYYFNLDLKNNRMIYFDSLFFPNTKEKILAFFLDRFNGNQERKRKYDEYLSYSGFAFADETFRVFFKDAAYYNLISSVDIPYFEIKKYISKNYLFLIASKLK